MSWVIPKAMDSHEEEKEDLRLLFLFISLMFPSGKLGVGPSNPYLLRF